MGNDLVEKNCLLVGLVVWELGFESDNSDSNLSEQQHLFTNLIGALEKKYASRILQGTLVKGLIISLVMGDVCSVWNKGFGIAMAEGQCWWIWWTLKQEDQKKFQYQKYVLLRRRFRSVCNFFFFFSTNAMYIILSTNKGYTYYLWC